MFSFIRKPQTINNQFTPKPERHLQGTVRFIPLGGIGDVTKNMYVYEYEFKGIKEILIVDCGVGFPDANMYGVDLVIPDITYLIDKAHLIKGIVLTHGHEDHIAALPYLWPKLKVPIYATRLTAALANVRLLDRSVSAPITVCDRDKILHLGNFSIEFIHVTHSIPDANHLVIRTPGGTFYHGSDYKFDWTPVDSDPTQVEKIAKASSTGITVMTTDSLGSDRPGYTLSERVILKGFEKEIGNCRGKFIVTTQSSNISRIQQAITVAIAGHRRICLLGRSIKQNVEVAQKLGYIKLPQSSMISEKEIKRYPANKVALIVAGSQGQVESALSRIALGDNKNVQIYPSDMVVFSADPIPGNEEAVHSLIDLLVDLGAEVSYSEVLEDLHVSGHGSQNDLLLLLALVKPRFVIPIGGTKRHMYHYKALAKTLGYNNEQILLLENGQVVGFENNKLVKQNPITVETVMVDGLGIGDVGNVVLRDRRKMAQDGIVMVIIPFDKPKGTIEKDIDVISRGFVYMKESEQLIYQAKQMVIREFNNKKTAKDPLYVKKLIEDMLEKFLYDKTHRRPMVMVVLIEV
ncbi:ribonuclease J [Candidatus Gottesmanbacteria bacterium]|nr:ribonuclease J [Candidatus Gottesmanbacteria bacterium]